MLTIRTFNFFSNQWTVWFEKDGQTITADDLSAFPSRFRDLVQSYHNQNYSETEAENVVDFFVENFPQFVQRG